MQVNNERRKSSICDHVSFKPDNRELSSLIENYLRDQNRLVLVVWKRFDKRLLNFVIQSLSEVIKWPQTLGNMVQYTHPRPLFTLAVNEHRHFCF